MYRLTVKFVKSLSHVSLSHLHILNYLAGHNRSRFIPSYQR